MSSSLSIVLLELEGLKDNMSRVKAELGRCVASLEVQSEETYKVLARLETVTAIVRAVRSEEECSLPTQSQLLNGLKSVGTSKTAEQMSFSKELDESDNENDVNSRTVMKLVASEVKIDKLNNDVDHPDCIETDLQCTRPSLLRKHRKNNKDKRDISENTETGHTNVSTSTSSNTVTQATRSVFSCPSCNHNKSSPSSITSSLTSSSTTKSISNMLSRVEDICSKQGWKVEGCYSSSDGREGCGVLHFHRLDVEGGRVEKAVRREFKTMESRLKELSGADFELKPVIQEEDGFYDVIANNNNNNNPVSSLPPPPVFSVRDCIPHDHLEVGQTTFEKNLTVSNWDAGSIFGREAKNIKFITKETGVDIKVNGSFRKEKIVTVKGKKACVEKALEMIEIIIGTHKSVKSAISSDVPLTLPPLFHARDCISRDFLEVEEKLNSLTEEMFEITFPMSNGEAGAIIGKRGGNKNYIIKESGVNIVVKDFVLGKKERTVKLKGKKASVEKALEMIENIIIEHL